MKGTRPLTESEVSQVLQSFKGRYADRDRALFLLGIKSGFRISELLSLRLRDLVNGDGVTVIDRVSVRRSDMKKHIEGRTVLLHPHARQALEIWLPQIQRLEPRLESAFETYVFQSRSSGNQPMSRVQAWRIIKQAFKAVGIEGKTGTHSMRKTFADRVYENLDHDLVRTQKAMGHKNINSTVSYLSFREEDIDDAILAM